MIEKLYRDKDWLFERYWVDELSVRKLAEIAGCTKTTIEVNMEKNGILRRGRHEAATCCTTGLEEAAQYCLQQTRAALYTTMAACSRKWSKRKWACCKVGSKLGVLKIAAKRIGMSFEDYMARRDAGLKRCMVCKQWLPKVQFGKSRTRGDGLAVTCLACVTRRHTTKEVGTRERRIKRAIGLYWCNACRGWQPKSLMTFSSGGFSTGLCRKHYNSHQRRQYKSNPERRRKAYQLAKERRAKAKPIVANEKRRLLKLFDGQCAYCGVRPFEEWDHFIPLKHGGKSVPGNVLPSCLQCNRSKHAENPFAWIAKQGFGLSEVVLRVVSTPPEQVVYEHKRNPNQGGELNSTAKLTNVQAREVRERYATGKYNYVSLAQEYDVGRWVISRIVRGETYNGHQD